MEEDGELVLRFCIGSSTDERSAIIRCDGVDVLHMSRHHFSTSNSPCQYHALALGLPIEASRAVSS